MPKFVYKPTGTSRNPLSKSNARRYNTEFISKLQCERGERIVVIINLQDVWMTSAAGKCVTSFISSTTIVEYVDIVNLAGLKVVGGTEHVLAFLHRLSKALEDSRITILNLTNLYLGDGGIVKLAVLLSLRTLKRIKIENAGLDASDTIRLLDHLRNSARRLTHVSFNNNELIGPRGARAIGQFVARCSTLIHLECGGISPDVDGTRALIKGVLTLVRNGSAIEWLNMKGSKFGPSDAENLSAFRGLVKHFNSLEFVNVMNSGIPTNDQESLRAFLYETNPDLARGNILLHDDNGADEVEEDSQFVELSMR